MSTLKPRADVLVLAPGAHFLGLKQLDVLHGDFGNAVRALVHVLKLGGQSGDIERFKFFFGDRCGKNFVRNFDGGMLFDVSFGGDFVRGRYGV